MEKAKDWTFLQNAVIIADEVHTIFNAKGASSSRWEKVVEQQVRQITDHGVYGFYGLTATPFADGLSSFIDINNLIVRGSPMEGKLTIKNPQQMISDFTTTKIYDQYEQMMQEACDIVQKDNVKEKNLRVLKPGKEEQLYDTIKAYMRHYLLAYDTDLRLDQTATYENHEVDVFLSIEQMKDTLFSPLHGKNPKYNQKTLRPNMKRSVFAGQTVRRGVQSMSKDQLVKSSYIIAPLLENLSRRQGKALVYSSYSESGSTDFIYEVLMRLAQLGHPAVANASIYKLEKMKSDMTAKEEERFEEMIDKDKKPFEQSTSTGLNSPIMILPKSLGTGVSIKGGVRQMHIVNVIADRLSETQIRGRPRRTCSHATLSDKRDWKIDYFQYSAYLTKTEVAKLNTDDDYMLSTCDVVASTRLLDSSKMYYFFDYVIKNAAMSCDAFKSEQDCNCNYASVKTAMNRNAATKSVSVDRGQTTSEDDDTVGLEGVNRLREENVNIFEKLSKGGKKAYNYLFSAKRA